MFFVPPSDSPLTQGDILDECPLVGLNVAEPPSDLRNIPVKRWLARVIVLTQACDLSQAKSGRVLVAQVHDELGSGQDCEAAHGDSAQPSRRRNPVYRQRGTGREQRGGVNRGR